MKCKFAQFLFRAFGITGGALAVLFVIYYYNLDMKLMRSVVVPFLNKHYDSVKREHHPSVIRNRAELFSFLPPAEVERTLRRLLQ